MNDLHFLSWNVRGCRNLDKRLSIFRHIKSKKPLICMLQETHAIESDLNIWKSNWGVGHVFLNPGTTRSAGQAFLLSKTLDVIEHRIFVNGRLHALKVRLGDFIVTLANIYAPNGELDRYNFLDNLITLLSTYDYGDRILIGGDFNVVLEKEDKYQGQNRTQNSQKKLKDIMKNFDLLDIWRNKHKTTRCYTWSQPSPLIKCRLDYFLVQNKYKKSVTSTNILTGIKSDHSIIDLTISLDKHVRGQGFWKLNSSVLDEPKYVTEMKELIIKVWDESKDMSDIAVKFDWLKFKIMEYTIKYCKERARNKATKESEILLNLEQLDAKICNLTASDEDINRFEELKQELELITDEKSRGEWVRSRVEFIEKSEKSNSYFFNKAKESFEKKTIQHLEVDGENITEPSKILECLKGFFEKLYSSNDINDEDITIELANISSTPTVSEDLKNLCEGNITLEECWMALKEFKSNKSPGCDGLTSEFYQKFWEVLGPKLVETLNACKERGYLSQSQRRGVITLLEKKGKDSTKIKNWRPVSLMNIDYKILTKSLAKRIEKCLPSIINNDQSGFLKGRYIGEGIRFVEDLIDNFDTNNIPGILVQLDFAKAFDSIEWNFLYATLTKFGFGDDFISWIKCCYSNIYSCVMNNGYSSNWFQLFRGMRQGCALSVYLFILCVEIMACMVRENKTIEGVFINAHEHKIKQFADDCTGTVKNVNSVHNLINTIEIFSSYSGLKLNIEKSLLVYLGPWRYKKELVLNMNLAQDSFNMLGIYIGRNKNKNNISNFTQKISKMTTKLQIWSQRNLSIVGRALVSKTHGISSLIYSLSMTDAEAGQLKTAQKALNNFLWNWKPPKVKHNVMISVESGLKTIDIESQAKALRLPWIHRILHNTGWADFAEMYFEKVGGLRLILRCFYDVKFLPSMPLFYSNLLQYSNEMFFTPNKECILWNNKCILVENRSLYFKEWHEKGVLYIQDLRNESGNWLSFKDFVDKYNIRTNYLKYFGVLSAVKNAILKCPELRNISLCTRPNICFDSDIFLLDPVRCVNISLAKSKMFYNQFILSKVEKPTAAVMWYEKYNISNEIVLKSMALTRMCTKESLLISFQFKVIHNIINCGANLVKWKLKESSLCKYCENSNTDNIDTIPHALVDCPKTKEWLLCIFTTLNSNSLRNLTKEEILFGVDDRADNLLCIVIKKYICDIRGNDGNFCIQVLMRNVYMRIIAEKNSLNEKQFNSKWMKYKELVTRSCEFYDILIV